MEGELALTIAMGSQSVGRWEFRLVVSNRSRRTLLIPEPQITGFRFRRSDSHAAAEWYTRTLQHGPWEGVVLVPGGRHESSFSIVACSRKPPVTDEEVMAGRFDRWCVDLRPGGHDVRYLLRMGEDYFDPDSHYRLPHVGDEARARSAEVWLGEATSNALSVVMP